MTTTDDGQPVDDGRTGARAWKAATPDGGYAGLSVPRGVGGAPDGCLRSWDWRLERPRSRRRGATVGPTVTSTSVYQFYEGCLRSLVSFSTIPPGPPGTTSTAARP